MATINSSGRIAATLYSLGTWFCLRNICINTLHKGDSTYLYLIIIIIQITLTPKYTQLLTPCSRILPENLTCHQLVKKFPAFYRNRRFITAFTTARHLSLSRARSVQPMPPSQSYFLKIDFNINACPYELHAPPISLF
jgi:hypothetical protein